jgi:hypothetical protein
MNADGAAVRPQPEWRDRVGCTRSGTAMMPGDPMLLMSRAALYWARLNPSLLIRFS